jgi:hypothetical protein
MMEKKERRERKSAGTQLDTKPGAPYSKRRVRTGLIITLIGFAFFILGARPDIFGLDRSAVIGFVQISVFEVGLGLMCLGGYISLMAFWRRQTATLSVDFGVRFVATGYVVTVICGMADVFGMGSHPLPGIPYFGVWQGIGVMIGEGISSIGLLLLIPWGGRASQALHQKSVEKPPILK